MGNSFLFRQCVIRLRVSFPAPLEHGYIVNYVQSAKKFSSNTTSTMDEIIGSCTLIKIIMSLNMLISHKKISTSEAFFL